MTDRHLTQEQLKSFNRDGFLVLPGMFGAAKIKELSGWIDELAQRPPERGRQMAYYENSFLEKAKKILSRIEDFADFHAGMSGFICRGKIIRVAGELLRESALLFKEKVNFKMPGGVGFEPHQDIQPGWDEYASYFISVLVTIDKSTEENGCLELATGHHKKGLIGRKWEPLQGEELRGIGFKKYPMEPGDVAFFDCYVPHQSGPNLSSKPRRNLYLTYNRASDGDHRRRYFSDKRKSFPPDFEREPGKEYKFKV